MKIISIANQKGGVGKTTTTMSLGAALATRGKQVLLIDLDPQGNLSSYLGYEPDDGNTIHELIVAAANGKQLNAASCIRRNEKENLDYIPATLALSSADAVIQSAIGRESVLHRVLQAPVFASYDYIFIDCLPSLGNLTLNAFGASDSVLVPVQAQKFAVDGLDALLDIVSMVKNLVNPRLYVEGILRTMQDRTNMSKEVDASLVEQYGDTVYNTGIGRSVEAANSTAYQKSLVSYKNKLGQDYEAFTYEFLKREEAVS
ncbi:MAG: ParA family protein [Candidatus Fimivivens sp.]